MEDKLIKDALDIFKPVMEIAVYSAARYANACNRNTVTALDMEYGMKFAAMNVVGKQVGSYFPDDVYQEESESEESESESEEDDFTRYAGTDETILAINKAYDEWDAWVPEIPAEIMIKRAIDEKTQAV